MQIRTSNVLIYKETWNNGRNGTTASIRCDQRRVLAFSHKLVLKWVLEKGGKRRKKALFCGIQCIQVLFMNQENKSQMPPLYHIPNSLGENLKSHDIPSSLRICGPLSLYSCQLQSSLILISYLSSKNCLGRENEFGMK